MKRLVEDWREAELFRGRLPLLHSFSFVHKVDLHIDIYNVYMQYIEMKEEYIKSVDSSMGFPVYKWLYSYDWYIQHVQLLVAEATKFLTTRYREVY